MQRIAALFVQKRGVYSFARGVDIWDVERDARKYPGPWPIVAHPPCQRWSKMSYCRPELHQLFGKDDGCFQSALDSLNRYGGVLEHPAETKAFDAFGISRPQRGKWRRLGVRSLDY